MLTRDLLRFRSLSGYARPSFLDDSDRKILDLCAELLDLWRSGINGYRKETEQAVNSISARWTDLKLPKGLSKIIADAAQFSGNCSDHFPENRKKLFLASAELLKTNRFLTPESFRNEVFHHADLNFPEFPIYADLPDFEKILSVPQWTPRDLIAKYNCVLVQSLILYSSSMEITAEEPDPAKLRRLFKQLKFMRLLAKVSMEQDRQGNAKRIKLSIDGPTSILENGTKYGLQLASFFPAVLPLNSWKISCQIKLDPHPLKLNLDSKSNLQGRFGRMSAYIPEEIRMFVDLFRKTSAEWTLVPDAPPFIRLSGQDFLFPDLTFSNGTEQIHLELFHKWHESQWKKRLEFLENNPDFPLILGLDRSLFPKKNTEDSFIRNHPLYGKKLFLFSGFPGVERVLKLLQNQTPPPELF